MKKETYDFIRALLKFHMDELHATRLYLRHQLSLKPEHRVYDGTEDEAEEQLSKINLNMAQYEGAITDFAAQQPPI